MKINKPRKDVVIVETKDAVVDTIRNSALYRSYQRAFNELTGLPLALRSIESWQLTHHNLPNENAFCRMMAEKSRSCSACLRAQHALAEGAHHVAHTVTCPVGLFETAVPVRTGDRLIALLCTGQAFLKQPAPSAFAHVARLAAEWGLQTDMETLKAAYFSSPVVSNKEHRAVVELLTLFAQHLSLLSNQILVQKQNAEPPAITRAKEFIQQHQSEDLSLGLVALAVNMSKFNFCKVLKRVTGINFTDHVSRARIESAKNLLLNPNLRVSEIAYQVGFRSLTHFNRTFNKFLGQSPSGYRAALPRALAMATQPAWHRTRNDASQRLSPPGRRRTRRGFRPGALSAPGSAGQIVAKVRDTFTGQALPADCDSSQV